MTRDDPAIATRILEAVDAGFDEQVALTAELVRFPSVRGQEAAAQGFVAAALRERGLEVDQWRLDVEAIRHLPGFSPVAVSYEEAWNVVGAHRARSVRGRSLILNGHIDVVPTGPLDQWSRPPFEPSIEEGWMHGRGAGDMKAGLVACVAALDALARCGWRPAADVFVQSVVEEECTGNGALACLARGYRAQAAIIPEPLEPRLLRAQVGVIWMQVRVEGDPQHASGATSAGVNAIDKAIELIAALRGLEARWNAPERRHPRFAGHPHPIRFNLGRIAGGDWTSSVPAWCTFDMRVGVHPGEDLAAARAEIEALLAEAAARDPFLRAHPPRVVYNGFMAEGYVLEPGTEAEATLGEAHRTVFGAPLEETLSPGTTDARFFGLYAGIPAMVYGPRARLIHSYDEAVELDSVRRVTQTLALFVARWCGLEPV